MSKTRKRILWLLATVPITVLVAAVLYMLGMEHLEGDPRDFWSSLEWAAETLSTTGYGSDARWQHPVMILFVILLQFFGVFVVFLLIPILLVPLLERRFETRIPRTAPQGQRQIVIYRYGPAVETLLRELARGEQPVLVIEQDEAVARDLMDQGTAVVFASSPTCAFDGVALSTARTVIANGSDEENAAVALMARQQGFAGDILAMVEEPRYRDAVLLAGASLALTPRHMLADALAARASQRISPRVHGIDQLGDRLEVREVRIEPTSPLAGQTLAEAAIGARTGTTVIGQWVGGQLLTQPAADMRIEPRGILVAIGQSQHLSRLSALAASSAPQGRRGPFLVAGFGEVGRKVVELLHAAEEGTRVVDRQRQDGVDIVGDILDPKILAAAEPPLVQTILLALDSDSATLFATVILRDLAPETPIIARVNRADNIDRIHQAGADFALSISQVSGRMLTHHLLRQDTVSVDSSLRVLKTSGARLAKRHSSELEVRQATGCSLVAVERQGQLLVDLEEALPVQPEDTVYACGDWEATHRFLEAFGPDEGPKA